jgi:hypothetical protein
MPLLVTIREGLHLLGTVRSREVLVTRDGSVQEKASLRPPGMFLWSSQGGDYEEYGLLDPTLKMGVMFLRNVGFSPKYMALQPRKTHISLLLHTFGKLWPY